MMGIKNILIVDDSKTSRAQLSKLLRDYDLQISTAESAEEAMDLLQQRQPDAIFLDHTMPGMDGLQALKLIKENPGTALIPVAMYTSKDDRGYAEQVRAQGAVDILYKPPTPNTVSGVFDKLDEAFLSASANAGTARSAADAQSAAEPATSLSTEAVEALITNIVRAQLTEILGQRVVLTIEEKIGEKFDQIGRQLSVSSEKTALTVAERTFKIERGALQAELEQKTTALFRQREELIKLQFDELKKELADTVIRTKKELLDQVGKSIGEVEKSITNKTAQLLLSQHRLIQKRLYWIGGSALVLSLIALTMQVLGSVGIQLW